MALITCPECGDSVSSLAQTCPHCGAPVRRSAESPSLDNPGEVAAEGCEHRQDYAGQNSAYAHAGSATPVTCGKGAVGSVSRNAFRVLLLATVAATLLEGVAFYFSSPNLPELLRTYVMG